MPGRRTLQNWDADTHQAVLLALVDHMKPAGSDWSAVVASLRAKGFTFTEGALVYVLLFGRQSSVQLVAVTGFAFLKFSLPVLFPLPASQKLPFHHFDPHHHF